MKKNNKSLIILGIISIIIVIIVTSIFAYAKFVKTANGIATARIAEIACYMDVSSSEASNTIINPYCNISVHNFDYDNESQYHLTQTDIKFRVEVEITPIEGMGIPQYYWEDSEGNRTYNEPVQGTFTKSPREGIEYEEETKTYKIVFKNTGELDITRNVKFNLVAIQDTTQV